MNGNTRLAATRRAHYFIILQMLLYVAAAASEAAPPNVVMILADDQSYRDFGFSGNDLVHTPHIDALASSAARYLNGYVPMSVCRPSLATLLTGLYPHQHGIHFNHPPPGLGVMRRTMTGQQYRAARSATDYLIDSVPTLPRILAKHGYACLQTGKHWEGSYVTAGFTHGMTTGMPAERLGPITGTREQSNGDWVAHGNGDAGLVIGRETMQPIDDFIDDHAEKPFFVWYAPFLPHTPFDAAEKYQRLFDGKNVPKHLLPYYAEIARFDDTVGHLMAHLEKRQLLAKTLIVFVADNGFRPDEATGQRQNRSSKLSQFQDGLKTPILIRWDGHTVAADHPQFVQTIDLLPTILSAVGQSNESTKRIRGIDLMPSALGRQPLPERPAFGAIYPNDAEMLGQPSRHVRGKWVCRQKYKLIVPGPARPPLPLALYDLDADPLEHNNLASSADHAGVVTEMTALVQGWWSDGDDSRVTVKPSRSRADPSQ